MVVASRSVTSLRRSPLHEKSVALGAKFAPFGGWEMPLEYAGGGVLAEHDAVRSAVGIFDVSHLGSVAVVGAGAAAFVNASLTNDLGRIGPGRAQYTLCCTEAGGVVDDLIAYLVDDDRVELVVNAGNTDAVLGLLRAAAPEGVAVHDGRGRFAVVAVQGPRTRDVLADAALPSDLAYMAFAVVPLGGAEVTVCRTGYTGEFGVELVIPAEAAAEVWDVVHEAVVAAGGRACGLGSRDTLRTEMGYPLHGHELSVDITPVEAGLGWAVGWSKPAFWGREVLVAQRAAGPARHLVGLRSLDRGIPRAGMRVLRDGGEVGTVTSGTFSPTAKVGIALALVDASVHTDDDVVVDVRGRDVTMRVVRPPFVPSDPR
ncbi:MAG: aminomethyltransferase [Frankiaceae bacterium]|nr:aminomethyltransferase [Frankiaceae bacterium]